MSEPVYIEQGPHSAFAVSLSWPGWARRARHAGQALEALLDYAPRYRSALGDGPDGDLTVVATVTGDRYTDFGAFRARGPWDDDVATSAERARDADIVARCGQFFDAVVLRSPAELRRGPRGGGRDRDEVAAHVREAERAYAAKIGRRVAPRTPWDDQRRAIVDHLAIGEPGAWPPRYAARIIAWHLLDHAWEIEDRS